MMVPIVFAISILSMIIYQDFRERAVYWFLFPVLLIIGLWLSGQNSFEWEQIALSFSFNIIILLSVGVYIAIKHKKIRQFINRELGIGDILLFFILPFFMSALHYILFFVVTIFLSLIAGLVMSGNGDEQKTIPLAGIQSLGMIVLLGTSIFYDYDLYNEHKIVVYLFYD